MEKAKLSNGLPVMYAGIAKDFSVCLSINTGHINEPVSGIAELFEKVLLLQIRGIIPVYGGTVTFYTARGHDLEDLLGKVSRIFDFSFITEETVEKAKQLIIADVRQMSTEVMRHMRLLYKYTAYGSKRIVPSGVYISQINSYSVLDVRLFAETCYTAANSALFVAGPRILLSEIKMAAEPYLGQIPVGNKVKEFTGELYTGGFERIDVSDDIKRFMFGWDVSFLKTSDMPAASVLMNLLQLRIGKSFNNQGVTDVQTEVRLIGYYGLRTLRVCLSSSMGGARNMAGVVVSALRSVCYFQAQENSFKKACNAAAMSKFNRTPDPLDPALEAAWQAIGRGSVPDVYDGGVSISQVSAEEVMKLAKKIFLGSKMTYVAAVDAYTEVYWYEKFIEYLYQVPIRAEV